jgi:hypothetical protein
MVNVSQFTIAIASAFMPQEKPAPDAASRPASAFTVSFPAARSAEPLDGRLLLILATDGASEPREQVSRTRAARRSGSTSTAGRPTPRRRSTACGRVSGRGAEGSAGGRSRAGAAQPLRDVPSLRRPRREAPARSRRRAALEYEAREPLQQAARGSTSTKGRPRQARPFNPRSHSRSLDQEIPPIEPAKDTAWIKHIKIKSERLSKFWG